METFRRSYRLVRESFAVLRKDKELIWFPIFSAIAEILLIIGILAPMFYYNLFPIIEELQNEFLIYVILFTFYVITYFIVTFFNAGLVACACIRLSGGDPTFRDGLVSAMRNIDKILAWSVFSSTVGIVLYFISEKGGIIGRIGARFANIGWSLITYFVVPVLIYNNVSTIDAIKASTDLFKKKWGEQVVGEFSISVFFMALAMGGLGFYAILAFLVVIGEISIVVPLLLLFLLIPYIFIVTLIGSALQGIFTAALYIYATTDKIPEAFSPDIVQHAFKPKHIKDKEANDTASEVLAPLIQK